MFCLQNMVNDMGNACYYGEDKRQAISSDRVETYFKLDNLTNNKELSDG